MSSIDYYAQAFQNIKPRSLNGRESPHKICMLLATLDLANAGGLIENKIFFTPALLERYLSFFQSTKSDGDVPNPHYPFYYLKGKLKNKQDSFWHLKFKVASDELANKIEVNSPGDINKNIEYAYLDNDLFLLIQESKNINYLEDVLSEYWFDRTSQDLKSIVLNNKKISQYQKIISNCSTGQLKEKTHESIRSPAFRKAIIQIYDYRCAATGMRVILPSGEALVEAAHIHPFSEAGDDDPRNGLALTPNMHWAMDKNIIAPGPDKKWHVSKTIDRRIADLQNFTMLEGLPLLLPKNSIYEPKIEALEWRLNRLR